MWLLRKSELALNRWFVCQDHLLANYLKCPPITVATFTTVTFYQLAKVRNIMLDTVSENARNEHMEIFLSLGRERYFEKVVERVALLIV
ncbi:hypothetical protein GCM10028817_19390 [Spirosoma pomorum]